MKKLDSALLSRLQSMVYAAIKAKPSTCDEVEAALGTTHQSTSPRFGELDRRGLICKAGKKRLTRSRRAAEVWRIR
jgi:predicted transcriptional regulator